jgi:hypothetical protein
MAFYKIKSGRVNGVRDAIQYIAPYGQIFYDDEDNKLRIGDGVTAGGNPAFIPVATSSTIGGIKLGPGVVLNGSGQIIIDSEGLDFSFGDLASTTETYAVGHPQAGDDYAVLSTINANEDVYLVSNGTGSINVIGEFNVYKTDGDVAGAIVIDSIFTVRGDGQIRMLVPGADSNEGALNIIGGLDGVFQNPVNTGVMLHITGIAGTPGVPSRVYNDAQNAFAAFVARRYNNTAASPSAVLADQEIMRLSGTAHNGTLIPTGANQRIVYVARGNQTLSNQGGAIELWATPLNSTTLAKVATVESTGIALESGKVLTGNVTGTATTATFAQSFNTGTLVTNAVSAQSATTAGTVTTAAQPAITSVGTLTSLTVTNLVTAKNYHGQARDAGTLGAAGTLTIDFATDHNVLINLTTTAVIAFSNITAGKTVTVLVKNATGNNRAVTLGVVAGNTSGGNASPNVNDGRTGVLVYRTFGTATTDIYCEFN